MSRTPIANAVLAPVCACVCMCLLGGACSRPAAVADAGPPPPAPVVAAPVRDAAADAPRDAPVDAPPDAAPVRRRAHAARPARPEPAGGFKVQGDIARADAERVLHGARPKLDACFDKARAASADLKGRVTFRLSVDARGRVPLAEVVSSTLGGGDPELCMVEALRDLKFPPSPGGGPSTLTFPMAFGR